VCFCVSSRDLAFLDWFSPRSLLLCSSAPFLNWSPMAIESTFGEVSTTGGGPQDGSILPSLPPLHPTAQCLSSPFLSYSAFYVLFFVLEEAGPLSDFPSDRISLRVRNRPSPPFKRRSASPPDLRGDPSSKFLLPCLQHGVGHLSYRGFPCPLSEFVSQSSGCCTESLPPVQSFSPPFFRRGQHRAPKRLYAR